DFEEQGIEIRFHVNENNHDFVIADREKLKRVFVNIIQNSIKHMKNHEKIIEFSIENLNEFMKIEIRDNGNGIEPTALPHIFDRFYRADNARNALTGGSGLGLAISKQIIHEHGGDIWVESELRKGTSIFFTLQYAKKVREVN
ncbi:ATP-binding protein, partial [Bacillus velezensis]|uniref:sensor histidine kinase n=1 Tax=Bacillus velezensis TaxID=492670 RepID=UPI002FFDAC8C